MLMDQLPQQINQTISPKQTSPLIKIIFLCIGISILSFILGFITKSITTPATPQKISSPVVTKPTPTIDESKLPISLSLLTNPVIYQWRGDVKGKLTKKEEHNFTITNDQGQSITITDLLATGDKWNTLFFDKSNYRLENKIPLSAIPLGSFLTGEFYIFKGGPNTPVGSMFAKQ